MRTAAKTLSRLKTRPRALLTLALLTIGFGAPTLQAQPPTFEVATIKPTASDATGSNLNIGRDRFSADNSPLAFILRFAYQLQTGSDDQIVGGPAWLRTARFDINAKADETMAARLQKMSPDERTDTLRLMIQALLVDRFNLKVHHETKVLPVLTLLSAKGGPKLAIASPSDAAGWRGLHNDGDGHVEGREATLPMLIHSLASQPEIGHRMVFDKTGLTEKYNFTLHWKPDKTYGTSASESQDGSLFSSLTEQLGLELKVTKEPVDVLVIDRLEMPTAN